MHKVEANSSAALPLISYTYASDYLVTIAQGNAKPILETECGYARATIVSAATSKFSHEYPNLGSRFLARNEMDAHIKKHTGAIICPICQVDQASKADAKRHNRTIPFKSLRSPSTGYTNIEVGVLPRESFLLEEKVLHARYQCQSWNTVTTLRTVFSNIVVVALELYEDGDGVLRLQNTLSKSAVPAVLKSCSQKCFSTLKECDVRRQKDRDGI